jgi:hypothetical protein
VSKSIEGVEERNGRNGHADSATVDVHGWSEGKPF